MTVQSLINNIIEKNAIGTRKTFNTLMNEVAATKLKARKRLAAQSMFADRINEDSFEAGLVTEAIGGYYTVHHEKMMDHHEKMAQYHQGADEKNVFYGAKPNSEGHMDKFVHHCLESDKHMTAKKQTQFSGDNDLKDLSPDDLASYHKNMLSHHKGRVENYSRIVDKYRQKKKTQKRPLNFDDTYHLAKGEALRDYHQNQLNRIINYHNKTN